MTNNKNVPSKLVVKATAKLDAEIQKELQIEDPKEKVKALENILEKQCEDTQGDE